MKFVSAENGKQLRHFNEGPCLNDPSLGLRYWSHIFYVLEHLLKERFPEKHQDGLNQKKLRARRQRVCLLIVL